MTDNIDENVLKNGKDGIKQNMLKVFDEFIDVYADEMWQIVNELIKLKAENAELRARLDKAVELPCKVGDTVYYIQYFCNYKKCDSTTQQICFGCKEMIERERRNEKYVICEKPFELKDLTEIGKKYFTDRAEAEARLKELQGGER